MRSNFYLSSEEKFCHESLSELSIVAHTCHPSIREVEPRGIKVIGHVSLYSDKLSLFLNEPKNSKMLGANIGKVLL